MKIDRVIFCLNSNPLYSSFWNIFSRVWSEKFKIKPTVFFSGTEEDLHNAALSDEFGDIIRLDPVPEVILRPSMDWSITWALFWGPTLFPEEVCMTSGLDQLPLNNFFIDYIKDIDEEDYIVGFSNAYNNPSLFPSSHHVSKGKNFKKIYKIENDWEDEIKKVFKMGKENYMPQLSNPENKGMWGLDEVYSSDVIVKNEHNFSNFHHCNFFHSNWINKRVGRCAIINYDKHKLINGEYTEFHSPRPYLKHKDYIDELISDLIKK